MGQAIISDKGLTIKNNKTMKRPKMVPTVSAIIGPYIAEMIFTEGLNINVKVETPNQ